MNESQSNKYEMCTCGHFGGNSPKSHQGHAPSIATGHGSCLLCGCNQFTWKYFARSSGDELPSEQVCQVVVKNEPCDQEVITSYNCRVEVAKTGEMVTENIGVCAKHIHAFEDMR